MGKERVLVVDDDEAVRSVVAAQLDRSGFDVSTAGGAEEAIAVLHQDAGIEVMMSDVMMPDIDGLALLDRVSIEFPLLPVVVFTAVHDVKIASSAFRRGAVDYLLKPFERGQLIQVVTRAAEQGRVRRLHSLYQHDLEEAVSNRTRSLSDAMRDLERSYDITLEALGDALDLRDVETLGHSRRVTAYTTAIAREMGVDREQLRVIARGAFLHDIGKIALPDSVLLKPGSLDDAERQLMREHCSHGYSMVNKIPFLREASEIVYAHQESFDGSGYPRGLKGEEIPLGARIFAVADTLDAITSDRPYRKGRSFSEAREEIKRCSGTQFDPRVVEVFLRIPPLRWAELRDEIRQMPPSGIANSLCRPESCNR
jgi:putative nucleotidyltransferase with HDIG domain